MSKKFAFLATTALAGSLMLATNAMAQSTGTTEVEEVTITASNGPASVDGGVVAVKEPKSRSAVTQEFISKENAGQSLAASLNLQPGYNFTNNDPYGSSGGNIRIRGFDGNRISLTFDGIPLNDTGNYAIFTNQQLDPELTEMATVNQGTTDVDSPTASATGGTVNFVTRKPSKEGDLMVQPSIGSFDYKRLFVMADTGEIGPYGTTAFVAGSYQKYNKFKGPGQLEKTQFNARFWQPIGDNGDFASVSFHYNVNRNNNYRTLTMAQFNANPFQDFDATCPFTPLTAVPGNCTNYYGRQVNPSNTGNIRGQFKYHLMDNLILTVDPSFQYVLADGGGQLGTLVETDGRLRGASGAAGVDLNHNGVIDGGSTCTASNCTAFFTPSVTNTRRYGVTSSVIWDLDDNNRLRFAYTVDYGRHRQTGEYTFLDNAGNTFDVFGGKDGHGPKVFGADGSFMRGRDRFSIASLQQFAVEYRGKFIDDRLLVNVGVRAPYFTRKLNQFCYSQNGSSNVRCTTETPATVDPVTHLVTFTGSSTKYVTPYRATRKYDKILPNVGVSFKLDDNQTIYGSYAEGLSAPRTDNLYTVSNNATTGALQITDVAPETTTAWDLGYRFQGRGLIISVAGFYNTFHNRIVSSFDDVTSTFIDRNVGDAKLYGVDGQVGWQATDTLSVQFTASYLHSELQSNTSAGLATAGNPVYAVGTQVFLPTKGKEVVETPKWQYGARVEWDAMPTLHFGIEGKHVDKRWSTDVNDEAAPAYTVVNADMRWDLPMVDELLSGKGAYFQLNVINLFDETYIGSISSRSNANPIAGVSGGTGAPGSPSSPTYNTAAPRTIQATLRVMF